MYENSSIFQKKKKNHGHKKKKQKKRKQKILNEENFNNQSDLGDLQPFKELDFETAWESYWGQFGEYLVWEGWVNKYPEQADFNEYRGMPCVQEVEITTEDDNVSFIVKSPQGSNHTGDNLEQETHTQGSTESGPGENHSTTSKNDAEELKSGYSGFQTSFNRAIENKMANLKESEENINVLNLENAEENNIVNQNAEMVHMMHCYSSSQGQSSHFLDDSEQEVEQGQSSYSEKVDELDEQQTLQDDVEWQDLWNEHYTESYWYYYSHFKDEFMRLQAQGEINASMQTNLEELENSEAVNDVDESAPSTCIEALCNVAGSLFISNASTNTSITTYI